MHNLTLPHLQRFILHVPMKSNRPASPRRRQIVYGRASHPRRSRQPTKKHLSLRTVSQAIAIPLTHLLVSELAEMLKNVAPDWFAIAFPINVLPVPGGPNSNSPANAQYSCQIADTFSTICLALVHWHTFRQRAETGEDIRPSHRPNDEFVHALLRKLQTSYLDIRCESLHENASSQITKKPIESLTDIVKRDWIPIVHNLHLNLGNQVGIAALESWVDIWIFGVRRRFLSATTKSK